MTDKIEEKEKKYDLRSLTEVSFQIIVNAGEGRSTAIQALYDAKERKFTEAHKLLELAEQKLIEAEKQHFHLIRDEAAGIKIDVPLILMHAEDQLMSTQAMITVVKEFVELREELSEQKNSNEQTPHK